MKYLLGPQKIISEVQTLNLRDRNSIISILIYIATFITFLYPLVLPQKAGATVSVAFVRFDRLATGADIAGTACLETTTTGTETNVVIDFPIDWTLDATASNWTVSTTNLPLKPTTDDTATAWPGIGTASIVAGDSVVFPGSDLSTNTFYCFHFSGGASSDVGAAGNDKTGKLKTQGGSPYVDSVDWATSVVTSGSDQITVTASVSAQLTFTLSGNSASLGTLSPSSTNASAAITETVTTNARNGWVSWVKSGTDGGSDVGALHSAVANADIDSPGSFNGTPETLSSTGGYVLDVNTGSGCDATCVHNEYEGADADSGGHLSYNIFRQTAHDTTPTSGDAISLVVKARSSATAPAASDYTDTLTINAAGSF